MNENPSTAQKVEKSIRKLADGCRKRPIIRQSAWLLWLTHVYAQLLSPLRITSRSRTSRTPAAIPRPPPPPRPPPQRLPCPAAPRPPLPCIRPPSRRDSRSSSTWQVPEEGAGISNLTLFSCTFLVELNIYSPPKNVKHYLLMQAVRLLGPPTKPLLLFSYSLPSPSCSLTYLLFGTWRSRHYSLIVLCTLHLCCSPKPKPNFPLSFDSFQLFQVQTAVHLSW